MGRSSPRPVPLSSPFCITRALKSLWGLASVLALGAFLGNGNGNGVSACGLPGAAMACYGRKGTFPQVVDRCLQECVVCERKFDCPNFFIEYLDKAEFTSTCTNDCGGLHPQMRRLQAAVPESLVLSGEGASGDAGNAGEEIEDEFGTISVSGPDDDQSTTSDTMLPSETASIKKNGSVADNLSRGTEAVNGGGEEPRERSMLGLPESLTLDFGLPGASTPQEIAYVTAAVVADGALKGMEADERGSVERTGVSVGMDMEVELGQPRGLMGMDGGGFAFQMPVFGALTKESAAEPRLTKVDSAKVDSAKVDSGKVESGKVESGPSDGLNKPLSSQTESVIQNGAAGADAGQAMPIKGDAASNSTAAIQDGSASSDSAGADSAAGTETQVIVEEGSTTADVSKEERTRMLMSMGGSSVTLAMSSGPEPIAGLETGVQSNGKAANGNVVNGNAVQEEGEDELTKDKSTAGDLPAGTIGLYTLPSRRRSLKSLPSIFSLRSQSGKVAPVVSSGQVVSGEGLSGNNGEEAHLVEGNVAVALSKSPSEQTPEDNYIVISGANGQGDNEETVVDTGVERGEEQGGVIRSVVGEDTQAMEGEEKGEEEEEEEESILEETQELAMAAYIDSGDEDSLSMQFEVKPILAQIVDELTMAQTDGEGEEEEEARFGFEAAVLTLSLVEAKAAEGGVVDEEGRKPEALEDKAATLRVVTTAETKSEQAVVARPERKLAEETNAVADLTVQDGVKDAALIRPVAEEPSQKVGSGKKAVGSSALPQQDAPAVIADITVRPISAKADAPAVIVNSVLIDQNESAAAVASDGPTHRDAPTVLVGVASNGRRLLQSDDFMRRETYGLFGMTGWLFCVFLFCGCCVSLRRDHTRRVLLSQGIAPQHGDFRRLVYGVPPGGLPPTGTAPPPPPWVASPSPPPGPEQA